ncbi:MAG TPA: type II toxin-antitoxin system VapB family antitoxin [Intrasporangium sp.]|uniref:type II toxin-antitoxin system VapB family antitoxin n=1 Tax=Intrasporangium sp. TaxID=1925024 RepID=UPI002F9303F9
MALNIKDEETDRLARELARITGESITVAARVAIAERLQRVRSMYALRANESALREIIDRGRARALLDARPVDEILGYDEHGLPS